MSAHSPIGVRVIVSDLVVSLSASLFIDLGCHFCGWTGIKQSKSTLYRSKPGRASYAVMKQLTYTVDARPIHQKNYN